MRRKILSNPYISLMYTAWQYAAGQKMKYLTVYGMFVASNLLWSAEPLLWGWFITEIQKKGWAVLDSAWLYAGAYLTLNLLAWVFHGFARVMERSLAFEMGKNFLNDLYHKTLHLPVKWHQDNHSGATINRVRKAYEALKGFFDEGFMYFNALAKFIFSFGAMLYFSPLSGSFALLFGVVIVMVIFRFDKPFIKAVEEVNEKEHVVSSTLFDSLSNIITVITLRLEQRMQSGLMQKVMDVFPAFRRKIVVNEWKWFTVDMMVSFIYAFIVVSYVYQHYKPGELFLIGGLVTLVGYVHQFTSVFHNVAWQYTQVVQYHTDIKTAAVITEAYKQAHLPDTQGGLPVLWKQIRLQGLHFQHNADSLPDGKAKQGLHGVNISISKGQKIALIGESGSGKSTLLALLRGLYPVEKIELVSVDGKQFQNLDPLSNSVTLFPQEPEIFENTIAYNITLGLPFTEEEIQTVCDTVHFTEVVNQLPQGLNSHIQEKGVNLSGGQKQRLALARGLFAAQLSDIILLDEPTSSVDPKTELLIYDKMFKIFKDKAIVSALHRLHLLPKFDYIYILDQGKVVDEGTFDKLFNQSEIFQELWKHLEKVEEETLES